MFLGFLRSWGQQPDEPARPQEPRPPYPYYSADVKFRNVRDSVTLAGTLTVPRGKGPFPAVVLISGSGLQNRNEEIMGHKPFLVLADYLTRRGIAVLRYDDRGAGESQKGNHPPATENFARDAEAAIAFLGALAEGGKRKGGGDTVNDPFVIKSPGAVGIGKKLDRMRLGAIGHSEGGTIAFILGSRNPQVSFIVSLAGCGLPGGEILLSQQEILARAAGTPEPFIEIGRKMNTEFFDLVNESFANDGELEIKVKNMLKRQFPKMNDRQREAQLARLLNPWMYHFIKYDPQEAIVKVRIPVLALGGSKDTQVASRENLPAIRKGLERAGNKDYTVLELDGLNHLFQECETGMINEYGTIRQTFSPRVLEIIGDWILERTGKP